MPDFDEDDEEFIEWNITNFLKNGKEVEKLPVTPASLTIFAKVGSIVLKYLAKKVTRPPTTNGQTNGSCVCLIEL